jgi:prolyl 4-hydroxylase
MESDLTSYIYNPLNAYLLIKRLTVETFIIQNHLRNFVKNPGDLEFHVQNINKVALKYEDLVGSVEALLRLQKVYKLNSSDFAEGIIDGKKTRSPLTAHDLFIIAKEASKLQNQEYFAIEYFDLTLERIKKDGDNSTDVNIEDLYGLQALTFNRTGNFKQALTSVEALSKLNQSNQNTKDLKESYRKNFELYGDSKLNIIDPFKENFPKNGEYSIPKEAALFGKACRGELKKSDKEMSKLHCRYFSKSFFSKIAPFKLEELSLERTAVYFFHDVISDSEIEVLKNLTKSRLNIAGIIEEPGSMKLLVKPRVAKLLFLDDKHEVVARLSKRVEVRFDLLMEVNLTNFCS